MRIFAWYVGDYYDSTLLPGKGGASDLQINADFLPPGFGTALYALGMTALVAALWRGRRFGPLAVEPLPVVVRASEATRGRARLYRRARAYGQGHGRIARVRRSPNGGSPWGAAHGRSRRSSWRPFSAPPDALPPILRGFCTAPRQRTRRT